VIKKRNLRTEFWQQAKKETTWKITGMTTTKTGGTSKTSSYKSARKKNELKPAT
jgi:hypothetical protein